MKSNYKINKFIHLYFTNKLKNPKFIIIKVNT